MKIKLSGQVVEKRKTLRRRQRSLLENKTKMIIS